MQIQHGVTGSSFGVSLKALGKMQKRINHDSRIARQPRGAGDIDACFLAIMIDDADKVDAAMLGA